MTGDSESAIPLLDELLEIQKARDDQHELAIAQTLYGAATAIGPVAKPRILLEEAGAILRRLGDHYGAAFALATLGQLALSEGEVSKADHIQHEALEHAQAVESEHMIGIALNQLGFVALTQQDLDLARSRFAQSARLHQHVRDREGLAYSLDGLAAVALAGDKPELAAKAIGAADAIRKTIGVAPWPMMRALRDPLIARIKTSLGDDAFTSARTAGSEIDPDHAVEELLAPAT